MTAAQLFYTPGGALRAPWRLAVFAVATFTSWVVAGALLAGPLAWLSARAGIQVSVEGWVGVAGLLGGHAIALRSIDRQPWSAVWLGRDAARPAAWVEGWGIGALAIGLPCAALLVAHELRMEAAPAGSWLASAARVAWFLLPAALMEELLTRGYVLAVLRDAWGWRWALAATSVGFGLLHLANAGATAESITMVALAGVMLGAIVLATRSLYAAWMAHFAWNWVMAGVLHSAVSGFPMETPNYRMVDAGAGWLTGGAWGPEGGVAAAAGMMAGLTYLYARRARREES
ncbi:MAG TPA: type II CAAX endopeptidase family protein [Gemmatimonadaceae bacterium]|nr:type II CAAX endopeptidase family protein [Gemmatimonadaceae bacterium]